MLLLSMKGRHWKWRMQGSSIYLAREYEKLQNKPNIIICSSLMDVSVYKSLISKTNRPTPYLVYYLHENQLTYPFSKNEKREDENFTYGFINFKSCLAADSVVFNSTYHQDQFLSALESLLVRLPDYAITDTVDLIRQKSSVLPVGIDFSRIESIEKDKSINSVPTLLWNHRWDDDKNPQLFLDLCLYLKSEGIKYGINLTGAQGNNSHIYDRIEKEFKTEIVHSGYLSSYEDYVRILKSSDILPVTSDHDFYGLSVLEAIYSDVYPILPREKVYHEYISESNHFYSHKDQFFELVSNQIMQKNKFNRPITLSIHNIHNVLKDYDLYIENLIM